MIKTLKHCLPFLAASFLAQGKEPAGGLGTLVDPGTKPVKLADGFLFTEGPSSGPGGQVYFTDIPNNRIHRWDPKTKKLSVFLKDSGGANGLYFTSEGDLVACLGGKGTIQSFYEDGGEKELMADQYDGKRFNKPNDLWIHPNGGIFFSDPNYGNKALSQDGEHVYYVTPYRDQVFRVIEDMKRPNGVLGTLDGKHLYVADHGAGKTFRYDIDEGEEGTLSNKTLFADSGSDGLAMDNLGNLYLTADKVKVYDPKGKHLGDIAFPERPSNLCFGGKDGKTLYVTARKSFYSLAMKVAGSGFKNTDVAPEGDSVDITISSIKEKLVYDVKSFTVKSGQKVNVTFKNPDFPPDNLLFVKPGQADVVAQLAVNMGADGFAKQFKPDTDKILWGTTMLDHGESEKFSFTAPQPGEYPYVCTFPGHALLMRGVMKVLPSE